MSPAAGEPELDQALEALQIIIQIRDNGRSTFDASGRPSLSSGVLLGERRKRAQTILSCARYRARNLTFSRSDPHARQDAYQPVSDLSPDILWDTCVRDTDPLVTLLGDLRQALEGLA